MFRKLTWDKFWGYMTGAGFVYVAMLIIDALTGTPFSLTFFFFYWDIIFALIIGIHWLLD